MPWHKQNTNISNAEPKVAAIELCIQSLAKLRFSINFSLISNIHPREKKKISEQIPIVIVYEISTVTAFGIIRSIQRAIISTLMKKIAQKKTRSSTNHFCQLPEVLGISAKKKKKKREKRNSLHPQLPNANCQAYAYVNEVNWTNRSNEQINEKVDEKISIIFQYVTQNFYTNFLQNVFWSEVTATAAASARAVVANRWKITLTTPKFPSFKLILFALSLSLAPFNDLIFLGPT